MNGKQLAEEVIRRFDSIKDEESVLVWIGDCQEKFGELPKDKQETFLNTLPKKYGGRKEE